MSTNQVEEAGLLLDGHWVYERLVAIAQVAAEPSGRCGDLAGWPSPVGYVDGSERPSVPARREKEREREETLIEYADAWMCACLALTHLYFVEGSLSIGIFGCYRTSCRERGGRDGTGQENG